MSDARQSRAKARWGILRAAILKAKQDADASSVSVRRHSGFPLLPRLASPTPSTLCVTFPSCPSPEEYPVCVATEREASVSVEEMIGFDNTGNVTLWPSEEILAALVVSRMGEGGGLEGVGRVLELGAGMTGLAGLVVAAYAAHKGMDLDVVLTDGNATSVELLEASISDNSRSHTPPEGDGVTVRVSRALLQWDPDVEPVADTLGGPFDLVMAADCLFFESAHPGLIHVLSTSLSVGGHAICIQPPRGGSAQRFVDALDGSGLEVVERVDDASYLDRVAELDAQFAEDELYDRDIHLPTLLVLKRQR